MHTKREINIKKIFLTVIIMFCVLGAGFLSKMFVSNILSAKNIQYRTTENPVYWKFGGYDNSIIMGLENLGYSNTNKITKIEFNNISQTDKIIESDVNFDLSKNSDKSVIGLVVDDVLYIQYDGVLYFNQDSQYLFNSPNIKDIIGLQYVNTSKVTDMRYMFANMANIKELDLSAFDTSNVTNMSYMFSGMSSLEKIYVSDKFKTDSTVSLNMFQGAKSLVGWNNTKYSDEYTDAEYAKIDTPNIPGYFSAKVTSSKYKINDTNKYIYVGNQETNKKNVSTSYGEVIIEGNVVQIKYLDQTIMNYDILSVEFKELNIKGNSIVISKEMSYEKFKQNIITNEVDCKIFNGQNEVTDGIITKEMVVKIYNDGDEIYQYEITDDSTTGDDPLDLSDLTIDEENHLIKNIELETKIETFKRKIITNATIKIVDQSGKKLEDNDVVKSGAKVIIDEENHHYEYTLSVKGDVTGTGTSNVTDVGRLYQYLRKKTPMEQCYIEAGNVVDTDSEIKITDVGKLYQFIKGRIEILGDFEDEEDEDEIDEIIDDEIPTVTILNNNVGQAIKDGEVIIKIKDNYSLADRVSFNYGWTTDPSNVPNEINNYIFYDSFGKVESETSIKTPSNLTGNYYLWIQPTNISDSKGNYNTTVLISEKIQLDNTPPEITITNPYLDKWVGEDVVNAKSYQLIINAKDESAISEYKYSYPDSKDEEEKEKKTYDLKKCNEDKTCSFSPDLTTFTTTPFLKERNDTVEITVCDQAGNCSNATTNIKIDITAPKIISYNLKENDMHTDYVSSNWTNQNVYLKAVSTDDGSGISKFQYSYDNLSWNDINSYTAFQQGSQRANFDMFLTAEGNYPVYLRAIDSLQNVGESYKVGTVKIDKTKPIIEKLVNPYENVWANKQKLENKPYQVTITATDKYSKIKDYKYYYPNSSVSSEREPKSHDLELCKKEGTCEYNDDLTMFTTTPFTKERNEEVRIVVCDEANNCSEQSTTIKIDVTEPSKPTLNMTHSYNNSKPDGQKAALYENNTTTSNDVYMVDKRWEDINSGGPKSNDNISGIQSYEISSDGVNFVPYKYNESNSLYKISTDGTHKRYIRSIDNALNVSEVREYTIIKEKIEDPVPILTCPDIIAKTTSGSSVASKTWTNKSVELSFNLDSNLVYDWYIKNNNATTWTRKGTSLTTGNITIDIEGKTQAKIVVKDTKNNVQKECYTEQYYIDKTAPTCTSSGGSSNWTNTSITLTGTCKDETNGSGCKKTTITKAYTTEINSSKESPGQISDNAGNKATCPANQTVKIDKTAPTVVIKAYKNSDGVKANNTVVAQATANNSVKKASISSYNNNVNGWLNKTNYPTGVYYEVTYSDNFELAKANWSWNSTNKTSESCITTSCLTGGTRERVGSNIKSEDFTLSGDGYRFGIYTLTDAAGNSVSINITAPIDKTAPTELTSQTKTDSANGTVITNSDKWTNKTLWWGNFSANEAMSQIDHFEYSTGCTGTKKDNLKTGGYTYGSASNATEDRTYCFRAVDKAGNISGWSKPQYFRIDKKPPTLKVTFKKWSDETANPHSLTSAEYDKLSNYTSSATASSVLWSDKRISTRASATDEHSGGVEYFYTTTGTTTNETNIKGQKRNIAATGKSTIQYKVCDALNNCTTSPKYVVKIAPLPLRKITTYNSDNKMVYNGKKDRYTTGTGVLLARSKSAMQSFLIDEEDKLLYISQQQGSSTKGAAFSKVNLANSTDTLLGTTVLENFGHAGQIDFEKANGKKYIWSQCMRCKDPETGVIVDSKTGKETNVKICEALEDKKKDIYLISGVCRVRISDMNFLSTNYLTQAKSGLNVLEMYSTDYKGGNIPISNPNNISGSVKTRAVPTMVAVDGENNKIVTLTGTAKDQYFAVYNLGDFTDLMRGNKSAINIISGWQINYSSGYGRQGLVIKGDYIYVLEGPPNHRTSSKAFISVFTLDGEVIVKRMEIGYPNNGNNDGLVWEPEGLKIYNSTFYVGYARGKPKEGELEAYKADNEHTIAYAEKRATIYKLISK